MENLNPIYHWYLLPEAETKKILSLSNQQLTRIFFKGRNICVASLDGEFFGINDHCPHAGTSLASAMTCNKKGVITCPNHHYKFYIKTGLSADGNNYCVPHYVFSKQEQGLYIGSKTA